MPARRLTCFARAQRLHQLGTNNTRHAYADCHRAMARARQRAALRAASQRSMAIARGIRLGCTSPTMTLRATERAANASSDILANLRTFALRAHFLAQTRGATAPWRATNHGAKLAEDKLKAHPYAPI